MPKKRYEKRYEFYLLEFPLGNGLQLLEFEARILILWKFNFVTKNVTNLICNWVETGNGMVCKHNIVSQTMQEDSTGTCENIRNAHF